MMTSVTMALSLLAVTASPTYAQPEDGAHEVESYEPESYELGNYGDSECHDCDQCESWGHGHGLCYFHHLKWKSPCNLAQHLMYYPAAHGYYYFRPYNHIYTDVHADMVRKWGGDPRNPYSNKLFERVYQEVEAEEVGGPFQDDEPEDLRPSAEEDPTPRSTRSKPPLLFPDETAAKKFRRAVRTVLYEK